MQRQLACALLLGALVALTGVAGAQAPDPQRAAAAQALFDEATREMEAGELASACPKLEEVTKLIPDALGARMALGECYEGTGRLASAWSQYAMVEGLAARASQTDRAAEAGRRAAELKPRLAAITIEIDDDLVGISGLVVARDGLEVGKAQWGVAFPADVGAHEILVTAPGHVAWQKTVEIIADGASTTVKVPMLAVDESTESDVPKEIPGEEATSSWQTPLAIGAMAVGGASLVVGAVLGGLAIVKNDESNESACNAFNQCSDEGLAMREQAVAMGNGSTALIIVGGVLAAGGVTLFLLTPSSENAEVAKLRLGLGGLRLEGSF